jgi:hypothetical protein
MKKAPASVALIRYIVARYGYENATLKVLRLAAMFVTPLAGLFRSKEGP